MKNEISNTTLHVGNFYVYTSEQISNMWFPRIRLCKMYAHACRIYISKTFQHFSGSKEHRNAKEEVHARESEEKRWEKETKSLDKVRKRGKKWEAEDRIGWTKREERQSEKESSFTRIRIQSACGVRASRIPSVTCFQSLSRYFPSHEICFITDIWEWRKRSPRNAITSATIFLNEGARADALTNDSRFSNSRKKKKKLRYWVRENLFLNIDPYVTLILLRCFFIHPRFEGESDFKRASRWSPHGDSLWVTQWKLRKI